MKKLVKLLLCMTLVLALTGCGKEQSATYELKQDAAGMSLTDTQVITAKGDKVITMKEVSIISFPDMSEEEIALNAESYDGIYGAMLANVPEGVTANYGLDGSVYKVEINMNYEEADLQELIDAGLVMVTSDQKGQKIAYISFKQTCEGLEAMGYTLVE